MDYLQEWLDKFYFEHGPCCAGCDWWRGLSSQAGECTKSAPVGAEQRYAMLGMHGCSMKLDAGHVLTPCSHVCGDFKDEFDWSSLPLAYLVKIGAALAPRP